MGYWKGRTKGRRYKAEEERRDRFEDARERTYQDQIRRQAINDKRYEDSLKRKEDRRFAIETDKKNRRAILDKRYQDKETRRKKKDAYFETERKRRDRNYEIRMMNTRRNLYKEAKLDYLMNDKSMAFDEYNKVFPQNKIIPERKQDGSIAFRREGTDKMDVVSKNTIDGIRKFKREKLKVISFPQKNKLKKDYSKAKIDRIKAVADYTAKVRAVAEEQGVKLNDATNKEGVKPLIQQIDAPPALLAESEKINVLQSEENRLKRLINDIDAKSGGSTTQKTSAVPQNQTPVDFEKFKRKSPPVAPAIQEPPPVPSPVPLPVPSNRTSSQAVDPAVWRGIKKEMNDRWEKYAR